MNETETRESTMDAVNGRVEWAITKLRSIRHIARLGGPVPYYHFTELREIIDSLRHHTEKLTGE